MIKTVELITCAYKITQNDIDVYTDINNNIHINIFKLITGRALYRHIKELWAINDALCCLEFPCKANENNFGVSLVFNDCISVYGKERILAADV